jgi:hypothetical protein
VNMRVMIVSASLPGIEHQAENRILADVQQPRDSPDRVALAKQVQDFRALIRGKLVHAPQIDTSCLRVKHKLSVSIK